VEYAQQTALVPLMLQPKIKNALVSNAPLVLNAWIQLAEEDIAEVSI
jgi:hypothetical protein